MFRQIGRFWRQHPALLYGLTLLTATFLGFGFFLALIPAAFLYFPLLFLPVQEDRLNTRLVLSLLLGCSALIYIFTCCSNPPLPDQGANGKALFHIDEIKPFRKGVRKGYSYRGKAKVFQAERNTWKDLPAEIRVFDKERPKGDKDYVIRGKLLKGKGYRFLLLPEKGGWQAVPGSRSWAEFRLSMKLGMQEKIQKAIRSDRTASFLSGLFTGIFEDPYLLQEFRRFGLQHILAISGFHFAIVAWLFSRFLQLFFPHKAAVYLILSAITSYFLFLGATPSILRAWLMATLFFSSYFLGRKSTALNSLGAGIICLFFYDPSFFFERGFQLSFAITASILFFTEPIDRFLKKLLKERPYRDLAAMSCFDQHLYIVLCLIRKALSLTIAVQLTAAPMILLMTEEFPLLGLLYNLFFPPLVSLSLFLLLTALLIPPLSAPVHFLNNAYTSFILSYVFDFPQQLDAMFRCCLLNPLPVIVYLTLLLAAGISMHRRHHPALAYI